VQAGSYGSWGMYWFHCRGVRPPAAAQIRWMAYWTSWTAYDGHADPPVIVHIGRFAHFKRRTASPQSVTGGRWPLLAGADMYVRRGSAGTQIVRVMEVTVPASLPARMYGG